IGALARQLVMTDNGNLFLTLYDDRYEDVRELWTENGDWADCLVPPLIVAMRQAGRSGEARELRDRFAADIGKLAAEGDSTSSLLVWRAELAALDGNSTLAARSLDAAVSAGWKGEGAYRVGFDADRDPVFALVRGDPQMQRAIARRRAAAAAEAASLKKLNLLQRPWASAARLSRPG
ncbi:MAG TPA: hypothetical protein VF027_09270, partial [Sphingomicrobium sp.]